MYVCIFENKHVLERKTIHLSIIITRRAHLHNRVKRGNSFPEIPTYEYFIEKPRIKITIITHKCLVD